MCTDENKPTLLGRHHPQTPVPQSFGRKEATPRAATDTARAAAPHGDLGMRRQAARDHRLYRSLREKRRHAAPGIVRPVEADRRRPQLGLQNPAFP